MLLAVFLFRTWLAMFFFCAFGVIFRVLRQSVPYMNGKTANFIISLCICLIHLKSYIVKMDFPHFIEF